MLTLRKGTVSISVDAWLKAQHPASQVTAETYVALYRAELERDGWPKRRIRWCAACHQRVTDHGCGCQRRR